MNLVKYLIATIVGFFILTFVSIAWPKFRSSPRPEFLSNLERLTAGTGFAATTRNILGISTDQPAQPVNVGDLTQDVVTEVGKQAEGYVNRITVTYTVRQLLNVFDKMDPAQKKTVRDLICVPTATPLPTP